jgi:hypothetical protein
MNEWWYSSDLLQKVFWCMAVPAGAIIIVRMITGFIRMEASVDPSDTGDLNERPPGLFTFRNLINFFLCFGWAGISLQGTLPTRTLLVLVSAMAGAAFVALVQIAYNLSKPAENKDR